MLGLKLLFLTLLCHQRINADQVPKAPLTIKDYDFDVAWFGRAYEDRYDPIPVVDANDSFVYVSRSNITNKLIQLDYQDTRRKSCVIPQEINVEKVTLSHSAVSLESGKIAVHVTNGIEHKLIFVDPETCQHQHLDLDTSAQSVKLGLPGKDSVDVVFVKNNVVEIVRYNEKGEVAKSVNIETPVTAFQNLHRDVDGYYNVVPVNGSVIQKFDSDYQLVNRFELGLDGLELAGHCGRENRHTVCFYKKVENETSISCVVVDKELTATRANFEITGLSKVDKVAVLNLPEGDVMITYKVNDMKEWDECEKAYVFRQSLFFQLVDKDGKTAKKIKYAEFLDEEILALRNNYMRDESYCVNALMKKSVLTKCTVPKPTVTHVEKPEDQSFKNT